MKPTGLAALLAVALQAAEPVIIAHRGASGILPEHTRESKVAAHRMGADYLEQDVVLSQDDVPIVLHDVHLDTTTDVAEKFPDRRRKDGRFYAIDLTAAEIATLNVTERFDHRTGKQVMPLRNPKGKGVFRVPTLEQELTLISELNQTTGRRAGIYPELKAPAWHRKEGKDLAAIVLPILRKHGYATKSDPCYLQCFEYAEVKRIREELGWKGSVIMLLGGTKGVDGTDFAALKTDAGLKSLVGLVDGIGPSLTDVI
ncbi:MAG: glycerophosphodiester phosphodiesterase, partial [Opitutales bacterium]